MQNQYWHHEKHIMKLVIDFMKPYFNFTIYIYFILTLHFNLTLLTTQLVKWSNFSLQSACLTDSGISSVVFEKCLI